MKVLLQEQDEGLRAVIRPMVVRCGMTVIEASDPWDCPALISKHAPDVVLLSAANIYEHARELAELLWVAEARPRLLLLGSGEPGRDASPLVRADGYLPYPFDAAKLARAIERVAGRPAPSSSVVDASEDGATPPR